MSLLSIGLLLTMAPTPQDAPAPATPRELGDVKWQRQLEAGLERSKKQDKPVLLLFQEIPG